MKYLVKITILALACALLFGCADKYATLAAKTALAARHLGDATNESIEGATRAVTKNCLAKYGTKTAGYAKCVAQMRVVAQRWMTISLPAFNALMATVYRALQLAKLAGVDKKELLELAKKALCMAVEIAAEFKELLPEAVAKYRAQINFALNLVKGATCH